MNNEYNNMNNNPNSDPDIMRENEKLKKRITELEKMLEAANIKNDSGTDLSFEDQAFDDKSDVIPDDLSTDGLFTFFELSAEELISFERASEKKAGTPITDFRIESYNGERVIKKYVGKGGDIVIPDGITCISGSTFQNNKSITSVIIPCSITRISELSFIGCSNLERIDVSERNDNYCSIDGVLYNKSKSMLIICPCGKTIMSIIPDSVSIICEVAFCGCKSLTSITIPENVTSIGAKAFDGCINLSSVTVLSNVVPIFDFTFSGNLTIYGNKDSTAESYAKKFNIPFKLIGHSKNTINSEFEKNTAQETQITDFRIESYNGKRTIKKYVGKGGAVVIPDGITCIGKEAFLGCIDLVSINIPNGVTSIGENSFWNCTSLAEITVADSVTGIEDCAFANCQSLNSITIPNRVVSIGQGAFRNCISLKSIFIPESVSFIASGAFLGCTSLVSIIVDSNNKNYSSADDVLYNKDKTKLIMCPSGKTKITLQTTLTSIGEYAFSNWTNAEYITLTNGFTRIENRAFYGCTTLKKVTIPNSKTSIGNEAFAGCKNLTIYGNKDSTAEKYANKHGIPFRIIERDSDTTNGKQNDIHQSNPLSDFKIKNNKGNYTITRYKGKSCNVIIPDTVSIIGDYSFLYCSGLSSIIIPNSVVRIGMGAFQGCKSLTNITIPSSVYSIGAEAFRGCKNLNSITIPNSVIHIGLYAFVLCKTLTIKCYKGSFAHKYAEKKSIAYELIG